MIEQKPFIRYKLDEEKREDFVKCRFNEEERKELELWKKLVDVGQDSTALKMALAWAIGDLKSRSRGRYRFKLIKKRIN